MRIDDLEQFRVPLANQAGLATLNDEIDQEFSVDLPAGRHRVEIAHTGADWVNLAPSGVSGRGQVFAGRPRSTRSFFASPATSAAFAVKIISACIRQSVVKKPPPAFLSFRLRVCGLKARCQTAAAPLPLEIRFLVVKLDLAV